MPTNLISVDSVAGAASLGKLRNIASDWPADFPTSWGLFHVSAGTVTADGSGNVSIVADMLGGGVTWEQPNTDLQPVLSAGVLQFRGDATLRAFESGSLKLFPTGATADHTKLVVLKPIGSATTQNILSAASPADGRHTLARVFGTETVRAAIDSSPGVQADTFLPDEQWGWVISTWDASAGKVSIRSGYWDGGGFERSAWDAWTEAANPAMEVAAPSITLGGSAATTPQLQADVAAWAIIPADPRTGADPEDHIELLEDVAMWAIRQRL